MNHYLANADSKLIPALTLLAAACFVWCGAATAPSFKVVVASVLGLTVLVEEYTAYLAALREPMIITPLTGPRAGDHGPLRAQH
jgi:hypothetical protein